MITADGWLDWATRRLGPAWKVNGGVNTCEMYLPHSAVGNNIDGWYARLDGPGRVSIHGWINKDGSVIQHYPLTAQCWGSGAEVPNNRGVAFENQGGAPGNENEPLTEAQIAANVRIIKELGEWKSRPSLYWRRPGSSADFGATLYEHREMIRFGADPTACPSQRIPWAEILRRVWGVEEGDDVYIISKAKTTAPDKFKSYLVRGKEFRHIPDAATFESLAAMNGPLGQVELFEPDDIAWEFLRQGATIIPSSD